LLNPGGKVLLNIVLLRAKHLDNAELVKRINGSGKIYVSATSWAGKGAVRIAVSNWMTGLERSGDGKGDMEIAKEVLSAVVGEPMTAH